MLTILLAILLIVLLAGLSFRRRRRRDVESSGPATSDSRARHPSSA